MMLNLAYVFPGQGSQTIGMLAELGAQYPIVRDVFAEVSHHVNNDIWQLIQEGPLEKLNQTEHTQVAMLTADVAVYRVLQQQGSMPALVMAGHSLGEYAALVCAEALSLADAARLVSARGRIMQQTVPVGQGAMAAIVGLDDDDVSAICVQASSELEQVTPANFNAIGQVVIAGHTPAVERAIQMAEEKKARLAKIIPVSVPCHCLLLKQAATIFESALAETTFQNPRYPVISNVDLSIYETPEQIRHLLQEQLYRPVRWVETIQKMHAAGVKHVIESGPGKVLSGLIKRIDRSLQAICVQDELSLQEALLLNSRKVD